MKLTERLRSRQLRPVALTGFIAEEQRRVTFHIAANGEVITDLRDPRVIDRPPVSTDMRCENCGAGLTVNLVDPVSRIAEMRCPDCGHHFHHRMERFETRTRSQREG
jgi:predicted RNA-binding Zn-ribbon protein involved in translation (DUF1610 family)